MVDLFTNRCEVEPPFVGIDQDWLAIIGSLSDSIMLIDRKGVVLFSNRPGPSAVADICIGDNVYSQFESSHQETLRRHVADVFNTGDPVRFEMGDAGGGLAWSSFLVKIVRDARRISRVLIIESDITEQKLARESRLNIEMQMLETQRLAAIARLGVGVGHEINNPLSIIQGYSEVLLSGSQSEDVCFQLNSVLAASQRINQAVKELNQLVRHSQPAKSRVDIVEILDQVISLKGPDLVSAKIRIINRVSSALPPVTANPNQMVLAIWNILTNAEQSLASVDRPGEITITSSQDRAYLKLHFSDNGSGIDPADIDKVFDPFFTTYEIDQRAGLGLSVSYSIARQNNGRLWVESILGEGSIFHLELPIGN